MSDFSVGPESDYPESFTARLIMQQGPAPEKQFVLTAVSSTIGRSPSNDIVINDPEASRRHAQIIQQADGFAIEDLGSTNGTFVNGNRCVGVTPLQHGDMVELGDTISLMFVHGADIQAPIVDLTDEDTADLAPVSAPVPGPPATPALAPYARSPVEPAPAANRNRRVLLGCGLAFIFLICCCGALALFLDSYQDGQFLYCGGLRPLWTSLLGPVGFNPPCS